MSPQPQLLPSPTRSVSAESGYGNRAGRELRDGAESRVRSVCPPNDPFSVDAGVGSVNPGLRPLVVPHKSATLFYVNMLRGSQPCRAGSPVPPPRCTSSPGSDRGKPGERGDPPWRVQPHTKRPVRQRGRHPRSRIGAREEMATVHLGDQRLDKRAHLLAVYPGQTTQPQHPRRLQRTLGRTQSRLVLLQQ